VVNSATNIEAKINSTQLDKEQADAQINSLSTQLAGMKSTTGGGSSVAQNPVLLQLNTQLAQVQGQLSTAQAQYTDSHPTVIALKQQLAESSGRSRRRRRRSSRRTSTIANPVYQTLSQQLAAARAMSASDAAQLTVLARQRKDINPELAKLPAQTARLAELKRAAKLDEDVYNALQQKYNDGDRVARDGDQRRDRYRAGLGRARHSRRRGWSSTCSSRRWSDCCSRWASSS